VQQRTAILCVWPPCIHRMDSGKPAAVVTARQPKRAPENAED
jgi:hypothetical protein